MAIFLTATNARLLSENQSLITGQISIIELAILSAISSNHFTAQIKHNTTVSINGTTITGSPMTNDDSTAASFFNVWQGNTVDIVKKAQMDEVISYFTGLSYDISRITSTGTSNTIFYWSVNW